MSPLGDARTMKWMGPLILAQRRTSQTDEESLFRGWNEAGGQRPTILEVGESTEGQQHVILNDPSGDNATLSRHKRISELTNHGPFSLFE